MARLTIRSKSAASSESHKRAWSSLEKELRKSMANSEAIRHYKFSGTDETSLKMAEIQRNLVEGGNRAKAIFDKLIKKTAKQCEVI